MRQVKNFKLPSAREMAEFDASTIASGISGLELMERAGVSVANKLRNDFKLNNKSKVLVLCGPGNNGGDGLVIARILSDSNIPCATLIASAKTYSDEFKANFLRLKSTNVSLYALSATEELTLLADLKVIDEAAFFEQLHQSTVVVDALLGTGQKSAPREAIAAIVSKVQESKVVDVVSVDLPTGINSDSGEIFDCHIQAKVTYSIQCHKRGLMQYPARGIAGDLQICDIDIDTSGKCEFELNQSASLPSYPGRVATAHKNTQGHVLVIGGARGMPGAAVLAARSALRVGAGLVTKLHLEDQAFDPNSPELMLLLVKGSKSGGFAVADIPAIISKLNQISAVIIGPGLGQEADTRDFFREILSVILDQKIPVVIDADGLNMLSDLSIQDLRGCVLTPHPKEMSRLLGISVNEVQSDRYAASRRLSQKYSCAALLKGPATVIYSSSAGYVNTTGNEYLATAGSGDVLSGIIAGLIAQGLSPIEATRLGAHLHGLSADLLKTQRDAPLIASDIIENLPNAIANSAN